MGTHFPAMHLASLESHHPVDLTGPPSFAATVLSRSALGLDGSIFNAPACRRPRCGCAAASEPRTLRIACSCGLPEFSRNCRGKVENALYYEIVKERDKRENKPPHFPCRKIEGAMRKNLEFYKNFLSFCKIFMICLLILD